MSIPPFKITPKILQLVSDISSSLGELKSLKIKKPSVKLRRENKIKTIHHSLAIEGNLLTEDQITSIIEKKRVIGPEKQILEVKNAIKVYEQIQLFKPVHESHLLKAHQILMSGLINSAGKYRSGQVGIFKGTKVSHIAPPAKRVPQLMLELFEFIKSKETPWLLKACVFHYEFEFIHPFEDGNGRMGRLWQQLLLTKHSSLFEFISIESLIHARQYEYYLVLQKCDKIGDSTLFIEFILNLIFESLEKFKAQNTILKPTGNERIQFAKENLKSAKTSFTRKEYTSLFVEISSATASRDLAMAVKDGIITKTGEKSQTKYRFKA